MPEKAKPCSSHFLEKIELERAVEYKNGRGSPLPIGRDKEAEPLQIEHFTKKWSKIAAFDVQKWDAFCREFFGDVTIFLL